MYPCSNVVTHILVLVFNKSMNIVIENSYLDLQWEKTTSGHANKACIG